MSESNPVVAEGARPAGAQPAGDDHPVEVVTAGGLVVETAGVDVIAESERTGKPSSLFWPWCAGNISIMAVSWGGYVLGFGLSWVQALLITGFGVLGSFLLVGVTALAGPKGSAPTLVLSRASFGVRGNVLPVLVSWLLLVGWEISLLSVASLASRTVFERLIPGSGTSAAILALIFCAGISIFLGVLGFKAIMRAQVWLTLATLVLTIVFIALTIGDLDWGTVVSSQHGSTTAVVGALVMLLAGFGVSWTNCAADYSRYLPRTTSRKGIVAWTSIGGALPVILLAGYGVVLCASDDHLMDAVAKDPVGALTGLVPTWFLVPFALIALLGLICGIIIDIYSSGLTLVASGIPISRPVAAGIDGVVMVLGAIYVVWAAPNFLIPFQGFLITVGVLLAAWSGIFLADLTLRRRHYNEAKLFNPDAPAGYGRVRWSSVLVMLLAGFVGYGLVTNTGASWLEWQGYLLGPLGGKDGDWAFANLGVLVALAIGFAGYWITNARTVRAQEAQEIEDERKIVEVG